MQGLDRHCIFIADKNLYESFSFDHAKGLCICIVYLKVYISS